MNYFSESSSTALKTIWLRWPLIAVLCFGQWANASQAQLGDAVDTLLEEYAVIRLAYRTDEDLEAPLLALLNRAEQLRTVDADNAAAWVACARVRFAYANTQGPVGGMRQIARSRDELTRAIELRPLIDDGYAQAYLGYLYSVMPSWPLSFGDRDKGKKLLEEALLINESSIANNYYYAWYLTVIEDYTGARERLDIAEAAIVSDPLLPKMQELLFVGIEGLRRQIDERSKGK